MKVNSKSANTFFPLIIVGALFFIFGFVTWLNGTLIPYLKISCELNNFQAYFVTFAFYISYFVMAIPSSFVLRKTGFRSGMSLGLIVMAIGTLVFIPAASSRLYPLFLLGLFIQGTGLALLQTASNPYVTILGPIDSAARRIGIMGICNKVAGVISPLILGAVVLKNVDDITLKLKSVGDSEKQIILDALASRVILPYIIMAVVLVGLALLLRAMHLPEIEQEMVIDTSFSEKNSVFQYPTLILGVVALFLYVGAEVIAGDTIIAYGKSLGIAMSNAKSFTSYTLASMVVGYILGILFIPKYITQRQALAISSILGIIFSLSAILTSGYVSIFSIALLGFANAMIWPTLWPLAIHNLGRFTKIGSSLLIMGIAGGALLPLLYGRIADLSSPSSAYWIIVPCYLFILYFAIKGSKQSRW